MSQTAEELLDAVRALPEGERDRVIDTLVKESEGDEFDPEWVAEVNRHSDEIEAGIVQGISWEDLEKKILSKHGDDV